MRVVGSACVVGLLIAGVAGSLRAADPPAVGIVNFDRVIKMHKPFQDRLDALKKEAKDLDDSFKARQSEFETVVNNLKKAAPGSPESNRLQQQAGKLQGELQQFINTERANLQKKEATLYVGFYKQIEPAIGKVAKAKGLKLVLKDQESTFDENQNVQELLKALNRSILYQEGLDITADIVKELAASPASPAGKSR